MINRFVSAFITGLLVVFSLSVEAQQHWMVYFKDKQQDGFNPYAYFDSKALERRARTGLPLSDTSDWDVNRDYLEIITPMVNEVLMTSRWFNSVAVDANTVQINEVCRLPFVTGTEWIEPAEVEISAVANYDTNMDENEAEILAGQLNTLGLDKWQKAAINGKGLRIAILDVGFIRADQIPAFEAIRNENRLIATRDFTKRGDNENVFYGGTHGTEVWSCIAGKIGNIQIGLATGAEFLLAKTEKNTEKFSEELNWLAAAEWADKNGADIINSSLGYTGKRYFNWQMDGHTSYVTRAANIAARKGILVVNAAGNEGDNPWHYIGAPADADSALSVGGIEPSTGYHTDFSSYGPTSDKRLKPNVVAYGHVIAASPSGLASVQGTSFASPLVAGFAACAWQTHRTFTNMQLFKEIEKSGSLYPYFDYAHGYGVPRAEFFLENEPKSVPATFKVIESVDSISVVITNFSETGNTSGDSKGLENQKSKKSGKISDKEYLYYNIMNKAGSLDSYYVLDVTQPEVLTIPRSGFTDGEILNVHYKGHSVAIKLAK